MGHKWFKTYVSTLMHCTNALHWRTAPTNWHTERIRHKRKSKLLYLTTNKCGTGHTGRTLRLQPYWGSDIKTFHFSKREIQTDGLMDRPQRHKIESRQRTNGTKTVFFTQLTNRPPIHRSKFAHWIEFTKRKSRFKSAKILHNHFF